MTRRTTRLCALLPCLSVACSSPVEESFDDESAIGVASQAIVNGEHVGGLGFAHSRAVAIFYGGERPCSGVYIDWKWVLTARHCVAEREGTPGDALMPASTFHVTALYNIGRTLPSDRPRYEWSTVSAVYDPVNAGVSGIPDSSLDLALLKLDDSLKEPDGDWLRPTRRPYNGTNDSLDDETLACFGYGKYLAHTNLGAGFQRLAYFDVTHAGERNNGGYKAQLDLGHDGITYITNGDSGGPCFFLGSQSSSLASITHASGHAGTLVTSLAAGTRGGDWVRWALYL